MGVKSANYIFFQKCQKNRKIYENLQKKWIFCGKMSKKSKNIREFATKIGFFLNVKKIEKLFETLEKKWVKSGNSFFKKIRIFFDSKEFLFF